MTERESTQRIEVATQPSALGDRTGVVSVISGARAGLVAEIPEGELTFGRTHDAMVPLTDDSLSRRHARFFRMHGAYFVEDLGSTNGTFLDHRRLTEPTPLADGACVQLGAETLLRFTLRDRAELEAMQRAHQASVRDPLTGLYNRRFLDERLAAELSYARRHGTPLSVLFVDADHFKRINDAHGHAAGDEVLRRIARFLQETMRSEDVVARFGGEEFIVVLRGIPELGVRTVAERVRVGVTKLVIPAGVAKLRVTVSVGVASQSRERVFASPDELLEAADRALYAAKSAGRDRVEFA